MKLYWLRGARLVHCLQGMRKEKSSANKVNNGLSNLKRMWISSDLHTTTIIEISKYNLCLTL